ncbi:MAG TPA: class I SAM-dependent methyltransferase [Anaeromyxobacteraceae bacterium]|nr:class I SAM-dependent methyltransferase [Anaeromyxobacteraceae bacterium]
MDFDAHRGTYREEVRRSISLVKADPELVLEVKAELLLSLLRRHVGDPRLLRVLDVGCGLGLVDRLIHGAVRELHAVDSAAGTVQDAARSGAGARYAVSDATALPYAEGTFDAAFAVCVMHHVPPARWQAFMGEMRRVLRPGGLAVVFEHNPLNPVTRIAVSRCEFDGDATLLGQGAVVRLARDAGLAPIERRSILYFPWRGALLRYIERPLGFVPLGGQYYVAARR